MTLPSRLTLAAAGLLATLATAHAQDRQASAYNGAAAVELPVSLLRGSVPAASNTAGDIVAPRKVRIIVASPYGN